MSGSTQSIWGSGLTGMGLSGSEGGVSVYGSGIQASTGSIIQCNTNDICLTRELLSFFYWSIQRSQDVVEQLFPATTANSAFVTKIQAFAWMNDYTFVRFVWLQEHPGQLFYTTNVIHRYELLDIYLRFNLTSWGTDPDVKDLLPRE